MGVEAERLKGVRSFLKLEFHNEDAIVPVRHTQYGQPAAR